MTTNTVSQFKVPNDLRAVSERSIEGGARRDANFEFLIVCVVLTAVIFGLINAVFHFTGGISAESVMALKGNNAPLVLPPVLP